MKIGLRVGSAGSAGSWIWWMRRGIVTCGRGWVVRVKGELVVFLSVTCVYSINK